MSRRLAVVLLATTPILLGVSSSDPTGDVVSCRRSVPSDERSVDLVRAEAEATEGGSALRFTMTFAKPLEVPDREGQPLRVDVLVRDPNVPALSFAYYRRLNRIVRFDSTVDPGLTVLLLPERGSNVFLGVNVDGRTLTMELPGRLLTRDMDLEGPPIERLTWSVVARDEGSCDFLGDGRPTLAVSPAELPIVMPSAPTEDPSGGAVGWVVAVAAGITAGGYVWFLRRRARER